MSKGVNSIWQLCPKCEGTGDRKMPKSVMGLPAEALKLIVKKGLDKCQLCKGHMIISILNGKPPKD